MCIVPRHFEGWALFSGLEKMIKPDVVVFSWVLRYLSLTFQLSWRENTFFQTHFHFFDMPRFCIISLMALCVLWTTPILAGFKTGGEIKYGRMVARDGNRPHRVLLADERRSRKCRKGRCASKFSSHWQVTQAWVVIFLDPSTLTITTTTTTTVHNTENLSSTTLGLSASNIDTTSVAEAIPTVVESSDVLTSSTTTTVIATPSTTSEQQRPTTITLPISVESAQTTTTSVPVSTHSAIALVTGDQAEYLKWHNEVRRVHSAADLTWSDTLAAAAQSWANKCVFEHSGGKVGPYGENLFVGSGTGFAIKDAVTAWTNEACGWLIQMWHPLFWFLNNT